MINAALPLSEVINAAQPLSSAVRLCLTDDAKFTSRLRRRFPKNSDEPMFANPCGVAANANRADR